MDDSGQKYSVSTGCLPWSQQHAPLQSHSHRKNQARATLKFLVGYSLQFPALTEVGDHHRKSHPRLVILIVLTNHQHNLEIKTKQHFKRIMTQILIIFQSSQYSAGENLPNWPQLPSHSFCNQQNRKCICSLMLNQYDTTYK